MGFGNISESNEKLVHCAIFYCRREISRRSLWVSEFFKQECIVVLVGIVLKLLPIVMRPSNIFLLRAFVSTAE